MKFKYNQVCKSKKSSIPGLKQLPADFPSQLRIYVLYLKNCYYTKYLLFINARCTENIASPWYFHKQNAGYIFHIYPKFTSSKND